VLNPILCTFLCRVVLSVSNVSVSTLETFRLGKICQRLGFGTPTTWLSPRSQRLHLGHFFIYSIYIQLFAVTKLDHTKLQMLMTKEKHPAVLLTTRETNILCEVVKILEPAYNAMLKMEESDALISLVAPSITSLHQ